MLIVKTDKKAAMICQKECLRIPPWTSLWELVSATFLLGRVREMVGVCVVLAPFYVARTGGGGGFKTFSSYYGTNGLMNEKSWSY